MTRAASGPAPVVAPMSRGQVAGLVAAGVGLVLPWLITFENLSPAGHRMLGIFVMAIILWVSEAVPMHATAALIILLEVLMLSDKAVMPLPAGYEPIRYGALFATLADPVIILVLGGFFLANGATKFQLDRNLSGLVLRPFGNRPRMVLLGLMVVSAVFSMFMSNTATTATMMAIALPLIMQFDADDKMRAGVVLAVPMAANIGGIGTPIGTPPNAIALGALSSAGLGPVPSFFQWMIGAVPFMVVFLLIGWATLALLFPTKRAAVTLAETGTFDRSRGAMIFYVTFAATVLLWMTEGLHGVNSNIIAFVPVVVMLCTRVFTARDLQSLDWHVLWLIAGGIALGAGITVSGMDDWFIGLFAWERMPAGILVAVLTLAGLVVGTVISHSATANLLVPIGISLAKSGVVAVSPVTAGVFIAIGTSLAMALPISTAPNAIAYATGEVKMRDMAMSGAIVGGIGWVIFVLVGPWFWRMMGILPE